MKNLFVTIPHSGERIPDLCPWLKSLPEKILMCDVDRFVDRLYLPILQKLSVDAITTDWHRYAVDLNRQPTDIDDKSVVGGGAKTHRFSAGFHWQTTTQGDLLMPQPMAQKTHEELTKLVYQPFHARVREKYESCHQLGFENVFHLDLHSMPSVGGSAHKDPGEHRADIVISDQYGNSTRQDFADLVLLSFLRSGFKVAYNWPYIGGRLTEEYGQPAQGHHVMQIELSRHLYMDEIDKVFLPGKAAIIEPKLREALTRIASSDLLAKAI